MFGWLVKKFDKAIQDCDGDYSEDIFQDLTPQLPEQANFQMEEGVSCLFEKVLDSVRYDFKKWSFNGYGYSSDNVYVCTYYLSLAKHYIGTLMIDGANFHLNHDACKRFENLWEEIKNNKQQIKKEEVLKKWGCK